MRNPSPACPDRKFQDSSGRGMLQSRSQASWGNQARAAFGIRASRTQVMNLAQTPSRVGFSSIGNSIASGSHLG